MRFSMLRDQHLDVRLIQAEHRGAIERNLVHERQEGLANGVQIPVVIQMLGIDRGHHRQRRLQLQERAIRLVGLGHEIVALAEPGVGAEVRHASAHHDRRVVAALGQHGADHRRRRGLAVGAGHRDAVLEPHELGQHLGPRDRRDPVLAGGLDLDVVARHRGGKDDHVRAFHVARVVADEDLGPHLLQALHRVGPLLIRAGHRVAEVQQDLGDARHADAADAHEMDVAVALKHGRAGRC